MHSFVVRVWREVGKDDAVWRGYIDHVGSGERIYFQNLEDVIWFIQERIGTQPADSPSNAQSDR